MTDNNKEDKNEKEDNDNTNIYGVNNNSFSSTIEIESDNISIIPYNNHIMLEHTNVIEKELDIDFPLLNISFNLNNNIIINNNIPKKNKKIKLFSSSLPGFTPKIYNNNIVIKDNDEIDLDVNKENIIKCFSSFRNLVNRKKETNIFVIINKILVENYTDSLQKLKENLISFGKVFILS
jgi:hypothetical protein